ncbi:hypothetical protein [Streptomyces sp. SLBN-31]|jgi:hypothetical protein|uniref:hypothetical protein n=1 Tax=Streptomyces sp. SLBN-31 TaxID=2768444 RepID=UPI001153C961|nr:hypothetical protein [Streptomyces sp. SLBN-31]TQJ90399.1 hypothetical protein FBY22_1181 [Streptomyces sp. SLBN-31]
MPPTTDPRTDPNAPLPRVDRKAAAKWAEEYTTYLARLTGVALDPSTARANFEPCLGRNDEIATDGRYSLFYYVNSPAPVTEHTRVVRTLRHELPQQGYEVTAYREFENAYASAVFRARDTRSSYLVTADTVGSGRTRPQRLSFAVRTPCLLPPGVEQQRF